MALPVPNPSTAAAGAKQTATTWNKDVRDAVNYLLSLQGGLGRRNFLKNAHMDVWQRGTSFAVPASTKTYTADRWVAYRTATGSTVSRQAGPTGQGYGLRYQRDPGNTSTAPMRIIQALPSANSLPMAGQAVSLRINLAAGADFSPAGKTVSLFVTCGTGTDQDPVVTWTGTADSLSIAQAVTTGATDYVFDNVIIPANTNQVKVEASWIPVGTAGGNDWCQINGVQVSAGSMAGFEQIPPEQNLAECQSFYHQWGPWGSECLVGVAPAASTTVMVYDYVLPVEMRKKPVVSFSATNHFKIGTTTTTGAVEYVGVAQLSRRQSTLSFTVASGLTVGVPTTINNNANTTNAAIYFNAEL